jgi:CheY-like chemotaxis protein
MSQAQTDRRPGVLVVDDEPRILAVLAAMLELEGFAAIQAANAYAALAAVGARAGDIDCALIDLHMPGPDGEEAGRLLRGAKPGLRCWLMTGGEEGGEPPPEGFQGVLAKPFSRARLHDCLTAMRVDQSSDP